ncbi:MAG: phospho-N-acetylmuramoyl-pentapeptide-transferase [Candidatus Omnitrophica bacterium]|nr:phospho-N-acetylmuramoyl-pentapeptide-transferase [Candidatus Omnitrophota bacterium]
MFYHLLYPLRELFFGFNIFRYITFRAAMAAVTAFALSMLLGPALIRKLSELKVGENIRKNECPGLYPLHKGKEGTPTMGGILILLSVIGSTLLWGDLTNQYVMLVIFATAWLGIIGFADDYTKLVKKRSLGLNPRLKFLWQGLLGLIIGVTVSYDPIIGGRLDVPFFKELVVNLGIFYSIFAALVIVGSSNAVNLTDGLDGLAIGCVIMAALAYSGMSYLTGHIRFSSYLNILHVPGVGELTVFCASIVGAGLGFLWYNTYPASVFMGDTGALALGGAIGVVAVLIKKELVLLLVGGIFVAEAVSVILQVGSYKLRRKRIFLIAPVHHHFQLKGWAEPKVTVRFWIIGAVLALLSLATLKIR